MPRDLVELLLAQLEKELPPLIEKFGGRPYKTYRIYEKILT